MRTFTLLLAAAILLPPLAHAQSCKPCAAAPRFDARCQLLTNPCDRASAAEEDAVLDRLFAAGKPVVFHVHGRGREPKKTLRKDLVGTIERDYDVRVLMFNWDSGFPLLRPLLRPVEHATASGPALRDAINRLARYRETHPQTAQIPVSLLVHSMGSIVLHAALDGATLDTSRGPLFANIVITGSDEDAAGHVSWVSKLHAQHAVVITINKNDSTLARARDKRTAQQQPLGRTLEQTLAPNATYVVLDDLVGAAHRIFEKQHQHRRVAVCRMFSALLRGEAPDLAAGGGLIAERRQANVVVPAAAVGRDDACFRIALAGDAPDEEEDQ